MPHLAAAPILGQLTELAIHYGSYSNGGITADGWRALARSPHLGNLTRFRASQNDMTDAGVRALASAPHLGKLMYLAAGDDLTENALVALADSPHLPALRVVWFGLASPKWKDQADRIRRRFASRFLVI